MQINFIILNKEEILLIESPMISFGKAGRLIFQEETETKFGCFTGYTSSSITLILFSS